MGVTSLVTMEKRLFAAFRAKTRKQLGYYRHPFLTILTSPPSGSDGVASAAWIKKEKHCAKLPIHQAK